MRSGAFRSYPGWTPNAESEIDVLVLYTKNKLERNLRVVACHAGLNAVFLDQPRNGYDFFGPTIQGPHSPDERASILLKKILKFLMEVLENIPQIIPGIKKRVQCSVIMFVTSQLNTF
jgi:dipeptidase D